MKTRQAGYAIVTTSLLLSMRIVMAQTPLGEIDHSIPHTPEHVVLTGYVREGQFRDPDTSRPIRYLYLELKEPIGKYVDHLEPEERGNRNVELVAGTSRIIYGLKELVGKKATVRGELPIQFDANAPKIVLPLVMSVDNSNPQLFN